MRESASRVDPFFVVQTPPRDAGIFSTSGCSSLQSLAHCETRAANTNELNPTTSSASRLAALPLFYAASVRASSSFAQALRRTRPARRGEHGVRLAARRDAKTVGQLALRSLARRRRLPQMQPARSATALQAGAEHVRERSTR